MPLTPSRLSVTGWSVKRKLLVFHRVLLTSVPKQNKARAMRCEVLGVTPDSLAEVTRQIELLQEMGQHPGPCSTSA